MISEQVASPIGYQLPKLIYDEFVSPFALQTTRTAYVLRHFFVHDSGAVAGASSPSSSLAATYARIGFPGAPLPSNFFRFVWQVDSLLL
jgi:hypothetical protein